MAGGWNYMIFQLKPFHDPTMHSAESRLLKVIGSFLKPFLENFAFSMGLLKCKVIQGWLRSLSHPILVRDGMLGDIRNKRFPEFTRALYIFRLLCQSNDTID